MTPFRAMWARSQGDPPREVVVVGFISVHRGDLYFAQAVIVLETGAILATDLSSLRATDASIAMLQEASRPHGDPSAGGASA